MHAAAEEQEVVRLHEELFDENVSYVRYHAWTTLSGWPPVRTHTWWRALVRVTVGLRRCKAAVCRGITLAWCVRGKARGAGERRR